MTRCLEMEPVLNVDAGVVVTITMGFHGRTQADTGDEQHERGDAKSLNNRYGSSMDWVKLSPALPGKRVSYSARCDWMRLEVVIPYSVSVRCSSTKRRAQSPA